MGREFSPRELAKERLNAQGRKRRNREVYEETVARNEAMDFSNKTSRLYSFRKGAQEEKPEMNVSVVYGDCLDVAWDLAGQIGTRVGLLNMAHARKPGGGVKSGCNAQEEAIFRQTTLAHQLDPKFYPLFDTDASPLDQFRVIFTPSVTIQRHGHKEDFRWRTNPREVGVITAAAEFQPEGGLGASMRCFIEAVLDVAVHERITHFVLSAWGSGAYRQDAGLVAGAFREAILNLRWRNDCSLKKIIFAILNDHNSQPPGNFQKFEVVMRGIDTYDPNGRGVVMY